MFSIFLLTKVDFLAIITFFKNKKIVENLRREKINFSDEFNKIE